MTTRNDKIHQMGETVGKPAVFLYLSHKTQKTLDKDAMNLYNNHR